MEKSLPLAPSLVTEARRLADESCAHAGISLTEVHDAIGTRSVSALLSEVWGKSESQMIDPALLVAIAHAGNLVAVALADGRPIGAAAGFCGPPGTPFHSHIVGLLPAATGRGMGRAIKLAQRAWCLERGIDTITWTFDPLVSRNARFNIRRLGANAVEYLTDFYGEMTDAINTGQHSDRMLIRWDLAAEPPASTDGEEEAPAGAHLAVMSDGDSPSTYSAPGPADRSALVAVPKDIEALRRTDLALARRWRSEIRTALTDLFAHGWVIVDFLRSGQYVLERTEKP